MDGWLSVDKPYGWTSFDVVNYVRKVLASGLGVRPKQVKVGHIGTLDPLASGLLVLLIGSYTKRASELVKLDKVYEATMKLGEISTTADSEGNKTVISNRQPSLAELTKALNTFMGKLEQTPPAYSAVKVQGQRAYDLARQGKPVDLNPRTVTVYSLELQSYTYPYAQFKAKVSSGTYIRSLVVDLGNYLATGAYLSELKRLQIGPFSLEESISPQGINFDKLSQHLQAGLPKV